MIKPKRNHELLVFRMCHQGKIRNQISVRSSGVVVSKIACGRKPINHKGSWKGNKKFGGEGFGPLWEMKAA